MCAVLSAAYRSRNTLIQRKKLLRLGRVDLMDKWEEVSKKYCSRCARKESCINLCALVLAAIWDLPCLGELERMAGYNG